MYLLALCFQEYEKACGAFLEGTKLEPGNTEIQEGLRYPTFPFSYISSLVYVILTVRIEICREALESLKISGSGTGKDLPDQHEAVGTIN